MRRAGCRAARLAKLAKPGISDAPRFANQKLRAQHRDELTAALDAVFSEHPNAHWLKTLTGVLPISPVLTVRQALDNPFLEEIDMIRPVSHPHDPEMKLLGNPLKFDGARLPQRVCQPLQD